MAGKRKCGDGIQCINNDEWCDGEWYNCADKSDEVLTTCKPGLLVVIITLRSSNRPTGNCNHGLRRIKISINFKIVTSPRA